ncbi:MAG: hypothetical protein E7D52_07100 [Peptoniphilus harei]|uniref:hypothetical protein n=1 Tax=Peptoniphilus harei TaxID=54005 RepID=UPI002900E6D7|nr:hypothetical protein [Peptoniphilus harei]MDU2374302.1 hypothetical protein [Peptoniphilus harei]MDU2402363.1 hypothetical protein [Bifidobacterium longum]
MRVLNNSTLLEEIEYINKVLRSKKRGFKKIALEDYGVDDLELLEQLNVLGYVKVKNKVVRELNITNSNIEIIEPSRQVIEPIIKKNSKSIPSIKEDDNALAKIDNDKLKLLLDNLDHLLKLIPKHKNVIYRSNNNSNISLRLDSGLYKELKVRAERNNKTISEMLNLVLEQYLENNN